MWKSTKLRARRSARRCERLTIFPKHQTPDKITWMFRTSHWLHLMILLTCAAAGPTTRPGKESASKPASRPATRPAQADDGSVLLPARDVSIHGTTVRHE